MRLLNHPTRLLFALSVLLSRFVVVYAADSKPPRYRPEVLKKAAFSEANDSGHWDDIWFVGDTETMMGRRDCRIYSISPATTEPLQLCELSGLDESKVVRTVNSSNGLWLINESNSDVPFAFNLKTRQHLAFSIKGLEVPGSHTPTTQSWVYVSQSQSALLMISGGDKATWPLAGNHPVYYWVSFRTGQFQMMPLGSSPYYFSPDQTIAVFSPGRSGKQFAIRMDTAAEVKDFPDNRETDNVPFNWTNRDSAKPLINSEYQFIGISSRGKAYRLDIALNNPYIPSAKATNQAVAFFMRGYGSPRKSSEFTLWHSPLKADSKPTLLSDNVQGYELLDNGICVYHSRRFGPKKASEEAFCFDPSTGKTHNLLDNIQRLEPLPAEIAEQSYAEDSLRVSLLKSDHLTKTRNSILCLFHHRQGDYRSFALPRQPNHRPTVERRNWRAAIYLNAKAERFHIEKVPANLFNDDFSWLNNTGAVFTGNIVWIGDGDAAQRQIQLKTYQLQFSR